MGFVAVVQVSASSLLSRPWPRGARHPQSHRGGALTPTLHAHGSRSFAPLEAILPCLEPGTKKERYREKIRIERTNPLQRVFCLDAPKNLKIKAACKASKASTNNFTAHLISLYAPHDVHDNVLACLRTYESGERGGSFPFIVVTGVACRRVW